MFSYNLLYSFKTIKKQRQFFFVFIDVLNHSYFLTVVCNVVFFFLVLLFLEYRIYVPIFLIYINIILCVYE